MEAYTSTLGLLTYSLNCPHLKLVSYLKLVPGFRACLVSELGGKWVSELVIEWVSEWDSYI